MFGQPPEGDMKEIQAVYASIPPPSLLGRGPSTMPEGIWKNPDEKSEPPSSEALPKDRDRYSSDPGRSNMNSRHKYGDIMAGILVSSNHNIFLQSPNKVTFNLMKKLCLFPRQNSIY